MISFANYGLTVEFYFYRPYFHIQYNSLYQIHLFLLIQNNPPILAHNGS